MSNTNTVKITSTYHMSIVLFTKDYSAMIKVEDTNLVNETGNGLDSKILRHPNSSEIQKSNIHIFI
jgi:hypothetical protein